MPERSRAAARVIAVGHAEVRLFADADTVVLAAADAMVDARPGGDFHFALAGGSTPEALYRRLADDDAQRWDRTHVWFGDERCVDPDHPDSNYRMANAAMLGRVPIPAEQIHRMRGELSADEAARRYEEDLRAVFGDVAWPRFDLILLGVGEDGHTASLFPGTLALDEKARWVAPNFVPQLGVSRVTLTMPVLCAAARVWIFAVGPKKAAILRDVLGDGHDPARWPVQGVVPTDGSLVWWLDEAAAAGLG